MELVTQANAIREALRRVQGVSKLELCVHPPVSQAQLSAVERGLDVALPDDLRSIYTEQAGGIEFSWVAEAGTFGKDRVWGDLLLLSPERVLEERREMLDEARTLGAQGMAHLSEGEKALVSDWPGWIPFIKFRSGDFFCLCSGEGGDLGGHRVVLLEHDVMDGGPSVHGVQIAPSVSELFIRWSSVGFVEVYDWSSVVDGRGLDVRSSIFSEILEVIAAREVK